MYCGKKYIQNRTNNISANVGSCVIFDSVFELSYFLCLTCINSIETTPLTDIAPLNVENIFDGYQCGECVTLLPMIQSTAESGFCWCMQR